MEAVKRPNAEDGDPNDVLRDHGIEDLKARLDEAFDPGAEETCDPGNGEYDEAGQRFDEVPLNDGGTSETPPNDGNGEHDENGDRFNEVPPNDGEARDTGETPRKERQKGRGKFQTTRCRDIELSFEDEWIIEDLLPGSGFGTIFGQPGCGKSFLALHLVLHAAAGIAYVFSPSLWWIGLSLN